MINSGKELSSSCTYWWTIYSTHKWIYNRVN